MAYPFRPCTLPNANPRLPKRVLASQTVTQRAGRNYGSDLDCIPRSERFPPTAAHRDNQGVPSRHLQISLHQRDPGTGFRTAGTSIVDCRWSPDCRSHVARFAASPYYWFAKNVWRAWMRRPHEVHACAGSRSGSIAGGTCGTFRRGHRPTSLNSLPTPKTASEVISESRLVSARTWLRGRDLNPRPLGYEPNELPGCSTPQTKYTSHENRGQTSAVFGPQCAALAGVVPSGGSAKFLFR